MRLTVEHPIGTHGYNRDFVRPANLARWASTVEAAGFDGIVFTEHPAPSAKWLEAGGHETLDPLSALTFCAAHTERVRLMTFLLVLPYRNPLLAAKQIATLDILSEGRATIATGGGYLRSEFRALGVDHDERNDLFDEALEVLSGIWTGDEFNFEGRHFTASASVSLPPPVQRPHPPLWIGGNSARARRRVARWGNGWAPLMADESLAKTTRTAVIDSLDAFRSGVAHLHELLAEADRDPAEVDVCVHWQRASRMDLGVQETVDNLGSLAEAGATWVVLSPPINDVDRCLETVQRYGDDVRSQL